MSMCLVIDNVINLVKVSVAKLPRCKVTAFCKQ